MSTVGHAQLVGSAISRPLRRGGYGAGSGQEKREHFRWRCRLWSGDVPGVALSRYLVVERSAVLDPQARRYCRSCQRPRVQSSDSTSPAGPLGRSRSLRCRLTGCSTRERPQRLTARPRAPRTQRVSVDRSLGDSIRPMARSCRAACIHSRTLVSVSGASSPDRLDDLCVTEREGLRLPVTWDLSDR